LGYSDCWRRAALVVATDDPRAVFLKAPFAVTPDRVYLAVSEYESDIWLAKLEY